MEFSNLLAAQPSSFQTHNDANHFLQESRCTKISTSKPNIYARNHNLQGNNERMLLDKENFPFLINRLIDFFRKEERLYLLPGDTD